MADYGYKSFDRWVTPSGLTAVNPRTNHLTTFGDQYGETVRNGPDPMAMIYASNCIEIESSRDQSIIASSDISGSTFSFRALPDVSPGDMTLWLKAIDDKPVLYLGDDPVDTDTTGLKADEPTVNHIAVFKDVDGKEVYNGPDDETAVKVSNTLAITTGLDHAIEASADILAPTFTFATVAEPDDESPSDKTLRLVNVYDDENDPLHENPKPTLYVGDDPVDTDTDTGIVAVDPKKEYVGVFKDNAGDEIYRGNGTKSFIKQTTEIEGSIIANQLTMPNTPSASTGNTLWVKDNDLRYGPDPVVRGRSGTKNTIMASANANGTAIFEGDNDLTTAQAIQTAKYVQVGDPPGPTGTIPGSVLHAEGDSTNARMSSGNYPIIRSLATPASLSGGGLTVNRVCVFANAAGDISPQTTPKEETPDKKEPATFEDPLEVNNPDPDQPAIKACQDSPDKPTTIQTCNQGGGGGQLQFGKPTPGTTPSTVKNIPEKGGNPSTTTINPGTKMTDPTEVGVDAITIAASAGVGAAVAGAAAAAIAAAVAAAAAAFAAAAGAAIAAGATAAAAAAAGMAAAAAALAAAGFGVAGAIPVVFGGGIAAGSMIIPVITGGLHVPGVMTSIPGAGGVPIPTIGGKPIVVLGPGGGGGGAKPALTPGGFPLIGPSKKPFVIEDDPDSQPEVHEPVPGETIAIPGGLTFTGECDGKSIVMSYDCATQKIVFTGIEGGVETTILTLTHDTPIVTATSPVNNSLVIFDGTSGKIKSPDAPITSTQGITINKSALTTENALINIKRGTAGLCMQVIPGASKNALYFNGQADTVATDIIYTTGKKRWGLSHDYSSTDKLMIESYDGTTTTAAMTINASDNIVRADVGFITPRFDLTQIPANPGTFNTFWYRSGGALMIGSAVLLRSGGVVVDTIPVFQNAAGDMNTAATTTVANLPRPLTVSAGNTTYVGTFKGTNATNSKLAIYTDVAANNNACVEFGQAATTAWQVGTFGGDNFFIWQKSSALNRIDINTAGLVSANVGISSSRHDVVNGSSNPGGTTTLWSQSSGDLNYGATKVLKTTAASVGVIPVYSTTSGDVVSGVTSSPASLFRPLVVSALSTTYTAMFKNSSTAAIVSMLGGTGATLELGTGTDPLSGDNWLIQASSAAAGTLTFKRQTTGAPMKYNDSGQLQVGSTELRSIDFITTTSNPGGTNTLWVKTSPLTLMFGSAPAFMMAAAAKSSVVAGADPLTEFSAPATETVTWTGTLNPSGVKLSMDVDFCRVGNQVTMTLAGLDNVPQSFDTDFQFINKIFPESMQPMIRGDYLSYPAFITKNGKRTLTEVTMRPHNVKFETDGPWQSMDAMAAIHPATFTYLARFE